MDKKEIKFLSKSQKERYLFFIELGFVIKCITDNGTISMLKSEYNILINILPNGKICSYILDDQEY